MSEFVRVWLCYQEYKSPWPATVTPQPVQCSSIVINSSRERRAPSATADLWQASLVSFWIWIEIGKVMPLLLIPIADSNKIHTCTALSPARLKRLAFSVPHLPRSVPQRGQSWLKPGKKQWTSHHRIASKLGMTLLLNTPSLVCPRFAQN